MKKTSHMIHTETKHVLITDESWPYKTLVHKVLPVCICDWRKLVIGLWVLQLKCISCLWCQISFELCTLPIWNHLLITHWAVIHPALLPIGLNSNFLLSLITTHGDTSTYPGRSRLLLFCWRSYSSLLFSNGGLSSSLHSCWIHLSSKKVRVKLITFCPT